MITFTKEQLIASAHARIEFAEMMLAGELEPLKERTWSIELKLARIALASLEAEPAGWQVKKYGGNWVSIKKEDVDHYRFNEELPVREVYTAPPAPVSVPDEVLKRLLPDAEKAEFWFEHDGKILFEGVKFNDAVFEACRAAMLQGAERVTTAYKLPEGWVACSERMPEEGSEVIVFRPRASESNDPPVKTATYKGGREYYHGFDCYCEPTHWMPLPAAPQQESKP